MAKKPTYHHGDLRNALLNTALEVLEDEGFSGVTLRAIAAKAGVSHAAPAYHFPTLKALVTAMCTIGFERFEKSMADARASAPQDPRSQMQAASDGYVAFAKAEPELFRLMFYNAAADWTNQAMCDASMKARRQLTEICAPAAVHLGLRSDAQKEALEELVWSSTHGYAHLMNERRFSQMPDESPNVRMSIAELIFAKLPKSA
jgi:AcrR family transcriptional regulator